MDGYGAAAAPLAAVSVAGKEGEGAQQEESKKNEKTFIAWSHENTAVEGILTA